jgi:hypothetical protein
MSFRLHWHHSTGPGRVYDRHADLVAFDGGNVGAIHRQIWGLA